MAALGRAALGRTAAVALRVSSAQAPPRFQRSQLPLRPTTVAGLQQLQAR